LNTPEAYAGLHEIRDIASQMEGDARTNAITRLRNAGRLLGFFRVAPSEWFKGVSAEGPSDAQIEALLIERGEARKAKDFRRSDEIRDQLAADGILIEDGPDGATWRRK